MPAVPTFSTHNETFRKLMGNGLAYTIPPFQRDYSWSDEEWEDLWTDILGVQPGGEESVHYMGYLVLQPRDDKQFDVIDGQQRLTTLSLIVLTALKTLGRLIEGGTDADNNRKRAENLRQTYIGYLDPVSLETRPKLTLNRNNNGYYKSYLVPLAVLPQKKISSSETLLRRAFEWFDQRLQARIKETAGDKGAAVATFVEAMADHLLFTVINVTDELNAYKVFETLNSRGVRLSATDLLKNHLFSILYKGPNRADLNTLQDRWENLVGRLGNEDFPDFLRVSWNSRNTFVRQIGLFKAIRGQVTKREEAFALLTDIQTDVENYLDLTLAGGQSGPSALHDNLATLKLFGVTQPYSLLLAVKRIPGLSPADFDKIVTATVIVSFRYNVIGSLSPSEQESAFHKAALEITHGKRKKVSEIVAALAPIYPSDNAFQAAFADKTINTKSTAKKRIARYILCKLEHHVSKHRGSTEFDSDAFNVEHILPQNPIAGWDEFPDESVDAFVFRLGNMTLLKTSSNRDLGNEGYAAKCEVYKTSKFDITKKVVADHAEWTPARVASRQVWMAKQAVAIWRISQLG